ncbi:beta-N-acetylhexosaminidase [Paenibacillus sp. J5C2022]|uniref:beta-N-acetylhexosaminidase n=1 Tax=Paenibacillus sp. J5C2022 TaxID=2977129 RepID=UPI0021D313F3|nr:beta-N-acetylhexosaminidase [Paenibacillus sp. J5C2022]
MTEKRYVTRQVKRTLAMIILIALVIVTGCSGAMQNKAGYNGSANEQSEAERDHAGSDNTLPNDDDAINDGSDDAEPPPEDPITAQIRNMTLEEKIGQLMIIGLNGTEPDAFAKEMIQMHKVGGFILYGDNIDNAEQTLALLNGLKELNAAEDGIPLLLSVDQEGGRVSRLPDEYRPLPKAMSVGSKDDERYTRLTGQALGIAVKSLGFNMNFAPVLDINSNPKNPVIGDRAYGTDAASVTEHGMLAMEGIRSEGVIPVVKHFPGHGDTSVDSHIDLPVVGKSLEQLEQLELVPFREAIRQDADVIMVAHLLLPQLDKDYPSSLSKEIVTGLLREQLQYDGVVVTDDMTMGGITDGYGVAEAAVKSLQAGTDLILVGHNNKDQLAAWNAIKQSIEDGQLSEQRLDQSVDRIMRLKQKYELNDGSIESIHLDAINEVIEEAVNAGQ